MTRPRLHSRVCVLIAFLVAIWGAGSVARAEQPPAMTPAPAELKTAPPPRAKPQVIYHLPRTSSYAATLHSQAKGQSNALPIDSTMPLSLQMSRAAANEAAARAQQEPSASPNEKVAPAKTSPQRTVKRPKIQSNRSQVRGHDSSKGRGPKNSDGPKSRKK